MSEHSKSIGPNGLPLLDSSELARSGRIGWQNFLGIWLFPLFLGTPIAFAIYKFGSSSQYEENILSLTPNGSHWVFLAALLFSRLSAFLNLFPMFEKEKVMRPDSGNLRSNMQIFRVLGEEVEGAVVLDMKGHVGRYNRANRSLGNFVENAAPVAVNVIILSLCFPLPTFVLLGLFAGARVLHQIRYINIGYGYVGHGVGYFWGLAVTGIMEGLLIVGASVA